jgi:hypothetical protein
MTLICRSVSILTLPSQNALKRASKAFERDRTQLEEDHASAIKDLEALVQTANRAALQSKDEVVSSWDNILLSFPHTIHILCWKSSRHR